VNWTAPASNGSTITGYTVQWTLATDTTFATPLGTHALGNVVTDTITLLTNGTAYLVRVRATNAVGSSSYSTAASLTPINETIGIRGSAQNTSTTNLTVSVTRGMFDAAPSAGDTLLAIVAHRTSVYSDSGVLGTMPAPSGWSILDVGTGGVSNPYTLIDFNAARGYTGYSVYIKTAAGDSTDDATFTDYAGSGTLTNPISEAQVIAIKATTGLRSPTGSLGSSFAPGTVTTITANGSLVTAPVAGDLLFTAFLRSKSAIETINFSALSGTLTQIRQTQSANGVAGLALLTAYEVLGTFGARTVTVDSTVANDRNGSVRVVFKP
jgi:hypothetical protein